MSSEQAKQLAQFRQARKLGVDRKATIKHLLADSFEDEPQRKYDDLTWAKLGLRMTRLVLHYLIHTKVQTNDKIVDGMRISIVVT